MSAEKNDTWCQLFMKKVFLIILIFIVVAGAYFVWKSQVRTDDSVSNIADSITNGVLSEPIDSIEDTDIALINIDSEALSEFGKSYDEKDIK